MANLLALIELVDGHPHPGSLEALGQLRRVGSSLGATVYTLVLSAEAPNGSSNDLIALLSHSGADRVILARSATHRGPLRFGSYGGSIVAACMAVRATLVLFSDSEAARDLAPRVAARLGAGFLSDAWVEIEEGLVLFEGDGERGCRFDDELEFPMVATVRSGRYSRSIGDEEAEAEVVDFKVAAAPDFEEIGAEAIDGLTLIESDLRVALGPDASRSIVARYAVEGERDELRQQLAELLRAVAQ